VVEVRSATSAYAEQVRPTTAPYTGKGRRPRPRYHEKPSSLASLALQAGQQACVELIWRRGSKGLQRGRFLMLRVRPAGGTPRRQARADGAELPLHWLLVEWPTGKPAPVKYWLSNLPAATPLASWSVSLTRWMAERRRSVQIASFMTIWSHMRSSANMGRYADARARP
jgi:DDE superfamily endonuclease